MISSSPSNQTTGHCPGPRTKRTNVLWSYTSHILQDPSAVSSHNPPKIKPSPVTSVQNGWMGTWGYMERAFWRYVIQSPRFHLLLPQDLSLTLPLLWQLVLIEPEWWQQLAWLMPPLPWGVFQSTGHWWIIALAMTNSRKISPIILILIRDRRKKGFQFTNPKISHGTLKFHQL